MIIKYREDDRWWVTDARRPSDYPEGVAVSWADPVVTSDALVECWQSKLEGENHHSMMDIPSNLQAVLQTYCQEDTIKRILWDILDGGGWM